MSTKKKETTVETETTGLLPETPEELTPSEYFNILNDTAKKATEEELRQLYENAMSLMRKYRITGQRAGALKLYNFARLCEKEMAAVRAGIDTYVNRRDVDDYIKNIAKRSVVIIDLENYERDIPDDVVDRIAELKEKHIFDEYYVVFTDYTGKERSRVEQERREKDPILFGAMTIGDQNQLNSRLYHIASWEDAYCDLTLDRMVKEIKSSTGEDVSRNLSSEFGSLEDFKRSLGVATAP